MRAESEDAAQRAGAAHKLQANAGFHERRVIQTPSSLEVMPSSASDAEVPAPTITAWLVEHAPIFLATVVGAACLKIFSINRGFDGTVRWLKLVRPRWSISKLHTVDTIVTTLLGAYIAWITFHPNSQANGFLAGLGWTGIINNFSLKQSNGEPKTPADKESK